MAESRGPLEESADGVSALLEGMSADVVSAKLEDISAALADLLIV